jgi:succinate dehydrogenase/fumarate reductase flavoprotein subunit
VQPEFSNGQIWARTQRRYAAMVIDEMAVFRGTGQDAYDDLVDSTTQAIWWLRNHGFLKRRTEKIRERVREASKYGEERVLYEC